MKCLKFAQICSKHALKYTIFINIQKRPNHFISGKLFQKRQNLAYLAFKKVKWQPWTLCRVIDFDV